MLTVTPEIFRLLALISGGLSRLERNPRSLDLNFLFPLPRTAVPEVKLLLHSRLNDTLLSKQLRPSL